MDPKDIRIKPRCLTFQPKSYHKPAAYTADGYMLPCCWLDKPGQEVDEKVKTLFDSSLHIDNNETIENIINAEPWQKFMSELTEKPELSSPICFQFCSSPGNPIRHHEKLDQMENFNEFVSLWKAETKDIKIKNLRKWPGPSADKLLYLVVYPDLLEWDFSVEKQTQTTTLMVSGGH